MQNPAACFPSIYRQLLFLDCFSLPPKWLRLWWINRPCTKHGQSCSHQNTNYMTKSICYGNFTGQININFVKIVSKLIMLKETSSFNHIAFTMPNIFSKKLWQLWLQLRHLWLQSQQLWFLRHKSKAAAAVNKKKMCYSSLVLVEMYINDCCPWASHSAVKLQCQTKDSSLVKQIERCLYQGELLACFTTHSCSNHFQ